MEKMITAFRAGMFGAEVVTRYCQAMGVRVETTRPAAAFHPIGSDWNLYVNILFYCNKKDALFGLSHARYYIDKQVNGNSISPLWPKEKTSKKPPVELIEASSPCKTEAFLALHYHSSIKNVRLAGAVCAMAIVGSCNDGKQDLGLLREILDQGRVQKHGKLQGFGGFNQEELGFYLSELEVLIATRFA